MTPRQTRDGRGAGRRAVRLVRVLLRGRRLEPELPLRADPRDPRAPHAADRRVSAAHRRSRVLARALLHRQGAGRVAGGAGAGAGRAYRFRAPPASIRRRFPASPGRRTSPRSSRPASSPSSRRSACSGCRCDGARQHGAALFAATAYGVATPAWAYATLFMGHGQTAGCLMIAFVAADALRDAERRARRARWPGSSASPAAGPSSPSFRPRSPRCSSACWRSRWDGLKAVPLRTR